MDIGSWQATVHEVTKSQTGLSMHTRIKNVENSLWMRPIQVLQNAVEPPRGLILNLPTPGTGIGQPLLSLLSTEINFLQRKKLCSSETKSPHSLTKH